MNTSLNAYLTKSLNEGFLKTSNSSIVPDALNNIIKNHSTIHPESRILINQEENLRVIIEQPINKGSEERGVIFSGLNKNQSNLIAERLSLYSRLSSYGVEFINCELSEKNLRDIAKKIEFGEMELFMLTNCNSIETISDMKFDGKLYITGCQNLKIISNVKLKNKLNIKSCPNLYQIYKTESKHYLCIDECDMLTSQDQLIKSRCKNGWITIRNTKAMINNRF